MIAASTPAMNNNEKSIYYLLLLYQQLRNRQRCGSGREYNTWYEKDAVLYDMTQTPEGSPVMLRITQAGRHSANMVISSLTVGKCPAQARTLEINNDIVPAEYVCTEHGGDRVEHYLIRDADRVNALVRKAAFRFYADEPAGNQNLGGEY